MECNKKIALRNWTIFVVVVLILGAALNMIEHTAKPDKGYDTAPETRYLDSLETADGIWKDH